MIPLGGVAALKNFFDIAMKKVFGISKYLVRVQTFPDKTHWFYKNVINNIDEDISAVV